MLLLNWHNQNNNIITVEMLIVFTDCLVKFHRVNLVIVTTMDMSLCL